MWTTPVVVDPGPDQRACLDAACRATWSDWRSHPGSDPIISGDADLVALADPLQAQSRCAGGRAGHEAPSGRTE